MKSGGGGAKVRDSIPETAREVEKKAKGQKSARAGSAAAGVEAMAAAAAGWPAPPPGLRRSEGPFWTSIMICRLPAQWAELDLLHAQNLARCLSDLEIQRRRLYTEGDLVGTKDARKINPRHALIETLTRRAIALTRVLQLHAVATGGRARHQQGAKGEAGAAAHALGEAGAGAPAAPAPAAQPGGDEFNPMDLIARPPRLQ